MEKDLDKRHLWPAIIAGGQGTRLFPLSHEGCPKQFCQLDERHTFVQATAQRFIGYGVKPNHIVVVTTTDAQTKLAEEQLLPLGIVSPNILQVGEACDYAGAMVMASEFIALLDPEAIVINTPADQHIVVNENFTATLTGACKSASKNFPTIVGVKVNDLVTAMGCGHALYDPDDERSAKAVTGFIEKPAEEEAKKLLREGGAAVNSGINVWLASQVANIAKGMHVSGCYRLGTDELMALFGNQLRVAIGQFEWHDCGTLKSLYDISKKTPNHKNASLGKGEVDRGRYCRGSLFVAAEGTKIFAYGVKNAAVVSSEIEGRFVLAIVNLADSQQVRALAEKYRDNKKLLTNDFSVDARNNIVVETDISREARFAFVGVDNYVVTTLPGPGGTVVFGISNNMPVEKLDL